MGDVSGCVGTLVSADADSLRFTSPDSSGVVAIPTASVARLERSRGKRSNAGRGAVIGGVIGGAAGLIVGIAASEEDNFVEIGPEEIVVVTALMGATGAGLGALVGAASKSERWEPVTVPGRVARRVFPGRSVTRARVSIGF